MVHYNTFRKPKQKTFPALDFLIRFYSLESISILLFAFVGNKKIFDVAKEIFFPTFEEITMKFAEARFKGKKYWR